MSAWTPPPVPVTSPIDERGTGRAGYVVGAILMVVSIGVIAVASIVGIARAVDLARFPKIVDASGSVMVNRTGGHVVFVVGPTVATFQPSTTPTVTVVGPNGVAVATSPYSGRRTATSTNISQGTGREALAIATFQADQVGAYRVTASGLDNGLTLGVGEGSHVPTQAIALAFVGGGLIFLIGLTLVIVTAVRRRSTVPAPVAPNPYPTGAYPPGPWGGIGPGSLAPPAVSSKNLAPGWSAPSGIGAPGSPVAGPSPWPQPGPPAPPEAPHYRQPRDEDFAPPGDSPIS